MLLRLRNLGTRTVGFTVRSDQPEPSSFQLPTMPNYSNNVILIGLGYFIYKASGKLIRRYFVSKLTVLDELANLDRKSTTHEDRKLYGTAVICGGSIAGLLTAKVCSYHFENVIIVESEKWITSPDSYDTSHPKEELVKRKRTHVAQYNATHIQLSLLVATLLKWFPNLGEECEKLGRRLVPSVDPRFYSGKKFTVPSYPVGQVPLTISIGRPGFEILVRRLIMGSCKNVRYVSGTVIGLKKDSSNSNTITGVQIHTSEKEDSILSANLAVDCTGSAFACLRWLKALATSDDAVQQLDNLRLTYNPKQSYNVCTFNFSDEIDKQMEQIGFPREWSSTNSIYALFPDPKIDNKMLAVMRRDKNTLELLLGGWAVTEEVSNIDDLKAYLSSMKLSEPLPTWISKTVDLLEESRIPMEVNKTRLGISVYIQYHLYNYMPSNFIAIGDSVMTLNPIKAFGSTKACMGALILDGILDKCKLNAGQKALLPDDFSQKFWKRHAACIGPEWSSYKADDYNWKTTIPSKGDDLQTFRKLQRKFGRLILELIVKDGYNDVAATAGYVRNYMAPVTDFLTPKVLWKIIRYKLFE